MQSADFFMNKGEKFAYIKNYYYLCTVFPYKDWKSILLFLKIY